MSGDPWNSEVWRPSAVSLRETRRGDAYAVRIIVEPSAAGGAVWDQLSRKLISAEQDVLLDGGASIRRVQDDVFEVVSGGEDVLDSLSWSLNVTVVEAVEAVGTGGAVKLRILGERKPPFDKQVDVTH
ncbi:hypothetical protein SAMN02745244_02803 [Tessaracoccus bendigoensis DSM 12906]|uniref:Uncharacterized protein n=1 Tax=Tessaracoccus bendigoensis DSM 12906 TaxID=1123357 RepID=A0A1M6KEW2_9ACTN|nr:hypothetical protein [Tessaracoccus bendigoensis]SHJ57473.1 hypothetical protein SAMN02745244_02803 [Tessaracoccus bendigoensis DSM 12906]